MIKGINESKTITKHISYECRCGVDGRKCSPIQKWNNGKCQFEYKKTISYYLREEDDVWIAGTCACGCDKDCEIGEYLKNLKALKSLVNDLVGMWWECGDTRDGMNDWFVALVLLSNVRLLLLVSIVV